MEKIAYRLSNGRSSYSLLHPEWGIIHEYQDYLESLALNPNFSQNTISSVAQSLKIFFEYLYAIPTVLERVDHAPFLQKTILYEVIMNYPAYLSEGNAAPGIAGRAAQITGSKPKSKSSCDLYLSILNTFLKASALLQSNILSASSNGLINIDVIPDVMFAEILERRCLSHDEQRALVSRSMIAGVISGGARYSSSTIFRSLGKRLSTSADKAFPVEYPELLLDQAKSYRDICLWSLLFGTGVRQSEGLQLLLNDVNAKSREVFVVNPKDRPVVYANLPQEMKDKLNWKGRETMNTYFLEPFKTIFFDTLPRYLKTERDALHAPHNFLFTKNDGSHEPHFMSSNSALNKSFIAAQARIGLCNRYTLHSCRHFYGVWCRNFIQVDGRQGLSLSTVQSLMGHASEKSTDTYAIKDKMILQAKIEAANELILKGSTSTSDIIKRTLECKLSNLQEKILGIK